MPKKKKEAGTPDGMTGLFTDADPEKDKEPLSVEDQIKALTTSVETLTEANKGLVADRKKDHDLTMSLLSTPASGPPAVIAAAPDTGVSAADLSALPDPVEDPKGYSNALNKLIADSVSTQIASFQDETDEKANADNTRALQVNSLWGRFQKANPELAKHEALVKVAAQGVVEDAIAKGIDGEKFMFGAGSGRFLEEVAESVTATIAAIRGDGKDEKKDDEEKQPDPALGVLPGMPVASGGGDPEAEKEAGDGKGGLLAEMKAGQEASGFF